MSFQKGAGVLIYTILFAAFAVQAYGAAIVPSDTLPNTQGLSEVVVTATRSDRKLTDVPIPVSIIGQEQIQSSGASRLDEILSEQTGLAIITNHGFGVQMQGMDPEYCLILINGEPVIGRTAGTLDLTRITLNDVERIEIMKGPSSSLYGSDALAGVINIITKKTRYTGLNLQTRYATNQTLDNTLTGSLARGTKGGASLSLNRFHTEGYDLMPGTYGKTVDPYTDYTLQGNLHYLLTPKLRLEFHGRYFDETQRQNYMATDGKDSLQVGGDAKVYDKELNPVLEYAISSAWRIKLRTYLSWYKTESGLRDKHADTIYDDSYFNQMIWKEELQSETVLNPKQILTVGTGFSRESVKATRYDSRERLSDYYLYAQHEWRPGTHWNLLSGLRYDMPSAYHSQLSPKIAAQYRPDDHWTVQASVGVGYKAPDFRQLYLSFSNPVVGYSVLGARSLQEGLAKMQSEGQIAQIYVNPGKDAGDLKPESSVAYNLGGAYTGTPGWQLRVNLFRNNVRDLIDTRTIALKTNGQPLYSYYNIHRVYTQGLEAEGTLPLLNKALRIQAGYQYLIARDRQVVDDIHDGKVFKRDPVTLETTRLSMKDYGGLFNRSTHTFNVKVYYTYRNWTFNTRVVYRGKFGFADMNGDNILDDKKEYAPGYALCHLDVGKTLWQGKLRLEAGVRDLFNYTDPAHLAYLPGRTGYLGATLNLYKNNSNAKN